MPVMPDDETTTGDAPARGTRPRRRGLAAWWQEVSRRGLRENILRYAGHLSIMVVVALGVWAARRGLSTLPAASTRPAVGSTSASPTNAALTELTVNDLPAFAGGALAGDGILRAIDLHTVMPSRPRLDVVKYAVQPGDTLFGIADKFALQPATILWGNYDALNGDPHFLKPGQELNILPVDGTLHTWREGEGLIGVAKFYGVTPQDIIDWPGNHLDPSLDPAKATLPAGTQLIIPGGKREMPTWRTPRIPRSNPASARILGPGFCGQVVDGPVGTGGFVWPTPGHWISGYHFDAAVHPGIDIGGGIGVGIFASDTGVVVYAGWNDWGYGYVIVIDHGNGWQTLYGHLSGINVGCGQAVFQGGVIGAMGCTGNCSGPHLHFEMMNDKFGKVNPLNFLP